MAGLIKPNIGSFSVFCSDHEYEVDEPTGRLPIAMRASLMSVISDAVVGADADVPKTRLNSIDFFTR